MAAHDAAKRKPGAAQRPVALHRLQCISRTSGVEAAAWRHQRAQYALVYPNQEDKQVLHFACTRSQRLPRCALSSLLCDFTVEEISVMTQSTRGNCRRWARKCSRSWRLIRFRSTACGACRLEIAVPNRGSPETGMKTARNGPERTRKPCAKVCLNSAGRRMRLDRLKLSRRVTRALPAQNLRNQAMAAFCTAPRQDVATTPSRHARPEAVGALAAQIVGLKGAFHGRSSQHGKLRILTPPHGAGQDRHACYCL